MAISAVSSVPTSAGCAQSASAPMITSITSTARLAKERRLVRQDPYQLVYVQIHWLPKPRHFYAKAGSPSFPFWVESWCHVHHLRPCKGHKSCQELTEQAWFPLYGQACATASSFRKHQYLYLEVLLCILSGSTFHSINFKINNN